MFRVIGLKLETRNLKLLHLFVRSIAAPAVDDEDLIEAEREGMAECRRQHTLFIERGDDDG